MYTVKDLEARFHLTGKSVRERISALGSVVETHITRGRNNAILLSDAGISLFDRLMQLEAEGYPTATAVDRLQDETGDEEMHDEKPAVSVRLSNVHPEMIEILKGQIQSLEQDKKYLQIKLDEALERIPALPPAEQTGTTSNRSLSRLQALRIFILGK